MHHAKQLLCVIVLCANLCVCYNWDISNIDSNVANYSSEEEIPEIMDGCANCTSCPGINQMCTGCCRPWKNSELTCFNGICQKCYENSKWICSNHVRNQEMLFTVTQIAMSAALILGIITILVLLWKICTGAGHRPLAGRARRRRVRESGRSVDTLQQIVTERLRDAPPPYAGTTLPPPGDTPPPYNSLENNVGHVNACFDPDYNAPPPCYNSITIQDPPSTGEPPKNEPRIPANVAPKTTDNSTDATLHI